MLHFSFSRSRKLIFLGWFTAGGIAKSTSERQSFLKISKEWMAILVIRLYFLFPPFLILSISTTASYGGNAMLLTLTPSNVTCPGMSNGTITSTLAGGSGGAVTYTLNPGSVVNTTGLFTGLAAGNYTVDASDGGVVATASVAITETPDTTKPSFLAPNAITVFKDAACNQNIGPAITGTVTTLSDNCTPSASLVIVYTDGAAVPVGGGCSLPFRITRTWRVTDLAGNYDEKTQVITVNDNIKPVLTIPPDVSLSIEQSTLPAVTGTATATDNCSPVTVTYSDVLTNGGCTGNFRIARTWSATDCSGNSSTGVQDITVTDNAYPLATVPNKSAATPADIPVPYANLAAFLADGGTASDNSGTVFFTLQDEIANGLGGKPGYCPTSITRIYRISDPCGNYTDAVQTITVLAEGGCSKCTAGTNFHLIDLKGQPTGSITVTQQQRSGDCCTETNCIAFNVRLDKDAVGVEILIDGATPSPQDWRIDCASVSIVGNTICLPGGSFHLFTFCKPGANKNDYTFRSVPGIIASGNINARVECNSQLSATGITSNPVWNSISPGVKGQYNSYLSSTTIPNPVFTADLNAPPVIQYEVCGNIGTVICDALGTDCATATVYVKQKINLAWNTDPSKVCLGNMPTLTANVSPVAGYTYEWFNGHGAVGTPIFSGSASYKPAVVGPYSIKVTDIQSGIACSVAIFDFDVTTDVVGPAIIPTPAPLSIQCGDPNASQLISNWLAAVNAFYTKSDGTIVNVVPSNDYAGISMVCNTSINVTFTALDQCGNPTSVVSQINIVDTQAPVFTSCPANLTINTDPNQCYASGVALGTAIATDNCTSPTVTSNAPAQLPAGTNLITWSATDGCGNVATCTQTVTVTDNIKPTITCPANVIQTALPGNCSLANVIIANPVTADNCAVVTQTWAMSGATTGNSPAAGINSVSGQTFNVGVTTVTYTVADAAGNTASCSFDVWIKDLVKPVLTSGCPADVTQMTDAGQCSAVVANPRPAVTDPCGEGFTVVNSFNGTDDASGTYPRGVTTVTWTITDVSGNVTTCTQSVTVTDNIKPTITCPANVTQTALPGNCSLANVIIANPVTADNCAVVTQTWAMSGATTGNSPAAGINSVSGQTFNVGVTTVTYTVADAAGNTASCSFDVWIKDLVKPVLTSGCPADVTQMTDAGQCSAVVANPRPAVTDPCGEGFTVVNSFNGTDDASGTYPKGVTTVTWTITDVSGNITTCTQTVAVNDRIPQMTCPSNISVMADFEKLFTTNVPVPSPVYSDDCPGLTLTWSMSGATNGNSPLTGINIFPSPYTFNQGITTIQYTLTDADGHSVSCSFTVTVLSKPDIDCQPDVTINNLPGLCSATLDPGFPVKLSGGEPITYTWSMTGATPASGTATGTGPIVPNPYTFNVGVTTITWTATNVSGSDICTQTITVSDNELPTFTAPGPFSFCVEDLISAEIVSSLLKINPVPDYSLFKSGSTVLDVNLAAFSDNCTPPNQLVLHWRIDFGGATPPASISGTGQPSAYGSDIFLPGDGTTFLDVNHTITYWVVDLSGNESVHKPVAITIHPRPAFSYYKNNNPTKNDEKNIKG